MIDFLLNGAERYSEVGLRNKATIRKGEVCLMSEQMTKNFPVAQSENEILQGLAAKWLKNYDRQERFIE
jgi:hypothetical protein